MYNERATGIRVKEANRTRYKKIALLLRWHLINSKRVASIVA